MSYTITHASVNDLSEIYRLFEEAIKFQQANNYIGWSSYDKAFIQADIKNKFLLKITNSGSIAGIFSICFTDELIWREKEQGNAIYLHRVVLNQQYKGEKIFGKVLHWAIKFAHDNRLAYIRMDTWAANEKIIAYYKSYGFVFVENYTTPGTDNLPVQHRNLRVALLQLNVESVEHNYLPLNKEIKTINHKINIDDTFNTIDGYWNQKVIGEANGQLVKLAKGIGEINWHQHDDQDELFLLYKGHLTIQLRSGNIELYPNELFIVPKGTEHCPVSHGESSFLIMGINITSNAAGGRPEAYNYDSNTAIK